MKKTSLLLLLFTSIVAHAQWNSTVNSPVHFSASANGTVPFSIMQQRFNLPPSGGDNGSLAFAGSDGNYSGGVGLFLGGNVASPIVWMYGFDDRNAFTIARKEYNSNTSEALVNGDLNPLMQVRANGYVGIGTTNPKSQFQIGNYSRLTNAMGNTYLSRGWYYDGSNKTSTADPSIIGLQNNGILFFTNEGGTPDQVYTPSVRMMIKSNGNVGIGTEDPKYLLAVNGTIGAKKVKVTQDNWPDYVFEKDYRLPSLKEVKEYIEANKHLPGVPSADEVAKEGLDVGDSQAVLLKKIEEITLYLIELKAENEKLTQRIAELEKRK